MYNFSANKICSAILLVSELDVNYKTALKLFKKCRVLMTLSNSEKIFDIMFYEIDTIYICAKTSNKSRNGKREQQPLIDR